MLTISFAIIMAYVGMWVGGLLGFNTDTSSAIFMLMGFLCPVVCTLEKIYDELTRLNKEK